MSFVRFIWVNGSFGNNFGGKITKQTGSKNIQYFRKYF